MDLSLLSEDIVSFPSCVSVGAMNNHSSLGWRRKSWNDLFENLILTLVFSAIEVKQLSKTLAICYGPVTVTVTDECLTAIKLIMPFYIFLRLFKIF